MKEGCNTIYILKVFTLYLQNNQTNLLVPKHSSSWKYLSIYYIFVTKSSNKIHTVLLYFTHIEQRHLGQMIWRPFLNHKSSWNSAPLSPKQKKSILPKWESYKIKSFTFRMDIEIAMHNLGDPVYLEVVKESTVLSNRQTLVVAKIKKTKKRHIGGCKKQKSKNRHTHGWLQKASLRERLIWARRHKIDFVRRREMQIPVASKIKKDIYQERGRFPYNL